MAMLGRLNPGLHSCCNASIACGSVLQQTGLPCRSLPLSGAIGGWAVLPYLSYPQTLGYSLSCGKQAGLNWLWRKQLEAWWGCKKQGRCREGGVRSSYESSSSGSSHVEDDDTSDYLQVDVLEAVSMVPSQGHLFMTLIGGREVEVEHINRAKGQLLFKSSTPTIFLKITHDSDLMLPIVVGDGAVSMLMKALHDDESLGRPNHYHLIKDMVGSLNYEVRMVRVTERVVDTYYARIYFGVSGEAEVFSVDARPSDAINLAVRCKVPMYVNKTIIDADGVRPVQEPAFGKRWETSPRNKDASFWDCADDEPDPIAEEITLMKSMLMAVVEERYSDAARWRDELTNFRSSLRQQRLRQI